MRFCTQLNEYMETLGCTARELSDASGLSAASLSRYRSGDRVPEPNTEMFDRLCVAIAAAAARSGIQLDADAVSAAFLRCDDVNATNRARFQEKFNTLLQVMNLNITRMCAYTNYDASTISRFRSGTRQPSDPEGFAAGVAAYVAAERSSAADCKILATLLACTPESLEQPAQCRAKLCAWLLDESGSGDRSVTAFLAQLDAFDLNEYIRAIHFDALKVPGAMFQLPTTRTYMGLREMKDAELDFLKATVLSKSQMPVVMYSDMPMDEMAKDTEFAKKWMFGMAMMLKKGLFLHQIHNLDRSFADMMLGLESWIPMYMTGQIAPYYLKNAQPGAFLHLLKVSGAAALSGEAIAGHHADGRYTLTKSKEELTYYIGRAQLLLHAAQPLMEIYRADRVTELQAFWTSDAYTDGARRNRCASLPLYTMDRMFLANMLRAHGVAVELRAKILAFAENQRAILAETLHHGTVTDEVPALTEADFAREPCTLPLAGLFYETDISYTYDEYRAHWAQAQAFAARTAGYTLTEAASFPFRNLEIHMHAGAWAMVSKQKSPAIHFVIRHPKLRAAIEQFVPPVVD